MTDLRSRVPAQGLMAQVLSAHETGDVLPSPKPGMIRLSDLARPWYTGAIGERRVGKVLSELGPEWTVLHSVPVGSGTSDIDHIVIGQPGVFTINTKHHPGKPVVIYGKSLRVDGHKTNHIRNAAHEAERAAALLSAASGMTVPVASIIVLVEARGIVTKRAPDGGDVELHVIPDHKLVRTLGTRPVLSVEQVQRIVEVAVLPETWHTKPGPAEDGVAINAAFEALHDGVAVMDARNQRHAYWSRIVRKLLPVIVPFAASAAVYWWITTR